MHNTVLLINNIIYCYLFVYACRCGNEVFIAHSKKIITLVVDGRYCRRRKIKMKPAGLKI
jgi:hypothetical protein